MLNKIVIHGRLTKIPELRRTNGGKDVCVFTLAVDRDSSAGGTDFIDCVAWEKRAVFVADHFTKGQEALVHGSLNMRGYEDKNGVQRTKAEVMVAQIDFCGPKPGVRKPTAEEQQTFKEITEPDGELRF